MKNLIDKINDLKAEDGYYTEENRRIVKEIKKLTLRLASEAMNEEKAREILDYCISDDNSLYCCGRYIAWTSHDIDLCCLDGDFTAEELEAICWWMRNKRRAK